MSEPAKPIIEQVEEAMEPLATAMFGTKEQREKRLQVQIDAQIGLWRDRTSPGSWLVWPFWALGWTVGYVQFVIRGLWWNAKRGYRRVMTTPWDEDEEE